MAPHQQRVVDEKSELDEKLRKLKSFLDTELFKTLPIIEKVTLREQATIMSKYSDILEKRIDRF